MLKWFQLTHRAELVVAEKISRFLLAIFRSYSLVPMRRKNMNLRVLPSITMRNPHERGGGIPMTHQYFFMKVGYGNSLLEACCNPDGTANFWVGFADHSIESASLNIGQNGVFDKVGIKSYKDQYKTRHEGAHKISPQNLGDILSLVCFSQASLRNSVRIVTFSPMYMDIWEIQGPLRYMNSQDVESIMNNLQSDKDSLSKALYKFSDKANKGVPLLDQLRQHMGANAKILPVKRICERVERTKLIPTINSIAVYSYFSQGTFRRIASADSGRQLDLGKMFTYKDSALKCRSFPTFNNPATQEKAYGMFMRRCLDYYAQNSPELSLMDFIGLPHDAALTVSVLTLNPGQLEMFATLLVMDLGFIAETGYANALDHIDVRARYKGGDGFKSLLTSVTWLKSVFGKSLHGTCLDILEQQGVIQIQCKNYKTNGFNDGGVLCMDVSHIQEIGRMIIASSEHFDFTDTRRWLENLVEHFTAKKSSKVAA